MRSIGRFWNRKKGDYVEMCSYCGMPWMRSDLRVDGGGSFVCPQEGNGRDATTLNELNQARTPVPQTEGYIGRG